MAITNIIFRGWISLYHLIWVSPTRVLPLNIWKWSLPLNNFKHEIGVGLGQDSGLNVKAMGFDPPITMVFGFIFPFNRFWEYGFVSVRRLVSKQVRWPWTGNLLYCNYIYCKYTDFEIYELDSNWYLRLPTGGFSLARLAIETYGIQLI